MLTNMQLLIIELNKIRPLFRFVTCENQLFKHNQITFLDSISWTFINSLFRPF